MNFRLIFIFGLSIEFVSSIKEVFECVTRRSGACKAFNISDDFDNFIELNKFNFGFWRRTSTIIEFDYIENKYSYNLDKNTNKKEFDTVDNPVVELLFSTNKDPEHSYRLVLGEKLNGLAYVEVHDISRFINYNNYSPDLPAWPFAINLTVDSIQASTKLDVYTRNGDGFDKEAPFLSAHASLIPVRYMSFRSRKKNVKLVAFYDCSTKYGSNCGMEKTQTITECRQKLAPLGSGLFDKFIDMSKFNQLGTNETNKSLLHYDEVFGVFRQNNDDMHILFSTKKREMGKYIRLTIGDEVIVRVRTRPRYEYHEKTAIRKGWNQEPSEPNFIRVVINSVSKQISIYRLGDSDNDPILAMKLCNYFDDNTIQFMSVTSNNFKNVVLYYDCCFPEQHKKCHVYEERNLNGTMDDAIIALKKIKGANKTKTFLDTRGFRETHSTLYIYNNGTSLVDYCPDEIASVH